MNPLRIGAATVLAVCLAMAGTSVAAARLGRTEALESLGAALALLRTEIQYAALPLPDALRRVAAMSRPPADALFSAVASALGRGGAGQDALADALRMESGGLRLLPQHREILLQVGSVLGRSDRHDQALHLTRAIDQLSREAALDRPEATRQASLWRTLGLVAGVAAAVLVL